MRLMNHILGKEIFIVTGLEEEDETSEIFITEELVSLKAYLSYLDALVDEVRVLHGVLTPAKSLPPSFRGKSVFLVAIDPSSMKTGYVIESSSTTPHDLARDIESVVQLGGPFDSAVAGIEDLFVFYGYQLGLGFTINEDEMDDEIIDTCQKLAEDADAVAITAEKLKEV